MTDRRIKIGVDIDGVLVDTDPRTYLEFCRTEFGWPVDYEAYRRTHSWYKATGQASDDVMGKAFHQFLVSVEESQQPIEGAHEALKALSVHAEIYLITARTDLLQEVTEDFIREHFADFQYRELSMKNLDQKAQRIRTFDLDYYIDDSYREISLILKDEAVTTKLIPFPAFHGREHWDTINDSRVHWLSIWNDVQDDMVDDEQVRIRKKAWEEIVDCIGIPASG